MHKTLSSTVFFIALQLLMSQCGKGTDTAIDSMSQQKAITFVGDILRVADNAWQAGDKIGVYTFQKGGDFDSAAPQVANSGYATKEAGSMAIFAPISDTDKIALPTSSEEAIDIYAYYPYMAGMNSNGKKMQLRYEATQPFPDILLGSAKNISAATVTGHVALKFHHLMAAIEVALVDEKDQPIKEATVVLSNQVTEGDFHISNKAIVPYNTRGDIHLKNGATPLFAALLIPSAAGSDQQLTISALGNTYRFKPSVAEWQHGKRYRFTLKLKSNAAQGEAILVDGTIADRDRGDDSEGTLSPSEDSETDKDLPSAANNYLDEVILGDPTLIEMARPHGGKHNYLVTHRVYGDVNYSLEFDTELRTPRFVAFTFDKNNAVKNVKRSDAWAWDPVIPAKYGYDRSDFGHYSRGHLVASNDRVSSAAANKQTFYLSNMTPQTQDHNAGVWLQLEDRLQNWARENTKIPAPSKIKGDDVMYVCKGATPDNQKEGFVIDHAPGGQAVSHYLWMAIVYKKENQYYGIAFLTDHTKPERVSRLSSLAMPIDELEEFTGYDLFYNLPDDIEKAVEAQNPLDYKNIWTGL